MRKHRCAIGRFNRMLFAVAFVAAAPSNSVLTQEGARPFPPHWVVYQSALENLAKAICENQKPCAPASDDERKNAVLSELQAREIYQVAIVSAIAEACQADWQRRNFLPLMRKYREELKLTDRQMAIVALMHGIAMSDFGRGFQPRHSCTSDIKARIEKNLLIQ